MKVLIYAGPAPWRNLVFQFSMPIVQHVATMVTLVTGGGAECEHLLREAAKRLGIPRHIPIETVAFPDSAQNAIRNAAHSQSYDLVILGRLQQPLGRLFHGQRSKMIAQQLEPSVLRVDGMIRPIQRILLTSGGDEHTFDNVRITAQLAVPLSASVTILHIFSQQSLLFEGFPDQCIPIGTFLNGYSAEALVLRKAAEMLRQHNVSVQVKGRVGLVLDEVLFETRRGNYDLLVVGAHCVASALDRILLENITGDLLDLSPVPVLVAKNGTH